MNFGNYYLKDVKLTKNEYGEYFLKLTYKGPDEDGNIHECILDGVPLPLYKQSSDINIKESFSEYRYRHLLSGKTINVGFGDIDIYSINNLTAKDTITEYAVKEMTIEEIEKKLGHKVKIVGKEED